MRGTFNRVNALGVLWIDYFVLVMYVSILTSLPGSPWNEIDGSMGDGVL